MEKLIIENRTTESMIDVLDAIKYVIAQGRISNNGKQYCYASSFKISGDKEIVIFSDLNKKSDRLIAINRQQ